MDSVDLDVLKRSAAWLDEGRRGAAGHRREDMGKFAASGRRDAGGSRRRPGRRFRVRGLHRGRHRRPHAAAGNEADGCEAVTYGVSADEARRFGLPCGGTIQLVLEPLTRDSGIRALAARDRGRPSGRAPARPPDRRVDAASGAGGGRRGLRRQDADDDSRPALPDAGDRRVATVEISGADRRRASTTRSRSAIRARNTRRPGTFPASRWCGRCPTTRCARCTSTSGARSSR